MSEQIISMAAKMYEARTTMRRLLGAKYTERMAECQKFITAVMERDGVNETSAAIRLAKELTDDGHTVLGVQMLAAAVEMIEPSEPAQIGGRR